MQRELWTKEDLVNALRATYYAGVVAQPGLPDEADANYRAGFTAALTTIAIHLGLPPAPSVIQSSDDHSGTPSRSRVIGRRQQLED
jgi:hypothetical protein